MAREERGAYRRADAVGADDQVGPDVSGGCPDHGPAPVRAAGRDELCRCAGVDCGLGEQGAEQADECGPAQQHERPAEPFGRGGTVRSGEPAPGRRTHAPVALPGGQGPYLVAEPDDVEGAL